MVYLRKHIGWLERHCHERAQKAERANLTITDRKPEFFFSTEKKAECLSTHPHPNNMDPCFPLDHNGPQLPRDLRDSRTWKEGKKAIYVGTNYPYLHPPHQETILNMSIIHKDLIYQMGFEGPVKQTPWQEHDHTLYRRQLQKRGEMLGSQNYFPLIVEFTKSSDEDDPTTPLAQHLIGFLKVLARLRLRYNGPIAMVMYPPIPRDW